MVIVIMGASGAGKTTVGRKLAEALAWSFVDADNLHSREGVLKMSRGVSLTDEDRAPWLERVRQVIVQAITDGRSVVVACSALRASYRAVLRDVPEVTGDVKGVKGDVHFVHLDAPAELLKDRISRRVDHFAPAALVSSQLAALEPPGDAVVLDAAQSVETLVRAIRAALTV
jgi:gluconokinase